MKWRRWQPTTVALVVIAACMVVLAADVVFEWWSAWREWTSPIHPRHRYRF